MFEIPDRHLAAGFAEKVDEPPSRPAPALPAATTVLLRDGPAGEGQGPLEVLLMRRNHQSRFVPGAWVFPGGRVDPGDSAVALHERIRWPVGPAPDPGVDPAFWAAALRELAEETGVFLARRDGAWIPDSASDGRVAAVRRSLMKDERGLLDVLDELDLLLDARAMVPVGHWVTPVVEPYRYDTLFFAVPLPEGRRVTPDPREMLEARWLTPAAALREHRAGRMPMVFPTIRTLESLRGRDTVEAALSGFRGRRIRRILPRLVRTEGGVGVVVDD
ncbi:MAG: NUDIX hydrolase [Gemmatimonadota bacterium]